MVAETKPLPADIPGSVKGDVANEKTISGKEVSSKIYKPISYEEAIANPIDSRRWKKAFEEEK